MAGADGMWGWTAVTTTTTGSVQLVVWVFHFLTVKDLAKASETCSRWHLLAQEDTLWRSLFFVSVPPSQHRHHNHSNIMLLLQ